MGDLSDEIFQDIGSFESSITSKLEEIEQSHEKERMKLSKLQYAKYTKLAAMYPSLHLFDSAMPKLKKHSEEQYKIRTGSEFQIECDYSSDEDDENMSIDYKIDGF